ncbi:MAG: zinc ribbon domain-containing protein [Candidatus Lokiarchaeota archaeon]|nr:zinc ribbon domain-containing protein [Candidatus Lokiarchaeota archaeon]
MNINVIYEETLQISVDKAFELSMQWLCGQHKAKIKKSTPPNFIEAKQGTMMTNTGHDPNWKKRIRINLYSLESGKSLIRVEATPLSRTIFRVDKLKESWYNGLFSSLFSLLERMEIISPSNTLPIQKSEISHCHNCGNKIDEDTKICPNCGIDVV